MDLNLVRLIFTLSLESDCADPHALFGIKPFFMDAFRRAAGCAQSVCQQCSLRGDCSYHRICAQFLSVEQAALKRYQKPSYPFVFDIPEIPPLPNVGRTVELGLTLAGIALNHTEKFIAAVQGMLSVPGLTGMRASVIRIESAGYDGSRTMITSTGGSQVVTLSIRGLQESVVIPADAVTVIIVTPLRIMSEGRQLREFSFSIFMRALMRRLSSLAYYYEGEEAEHDFKWLAAQSLAVETVAADFKWVDQGSKWSGLVGSGTFAHVPLDFHPFLLAGEYLHVGKGASFGLGAFRVNKAA